MVSVLTLVFAFRDLRRARVRVRHGRHRHDHDHHAAVLLLARHQWGKPLWLVLLGGGGFLLVDLLFLAANLTKLAHGAWLPLLIGVAVFTVLITWQRGRAIVTAPARARRGLAARVRRRAARAPPAAAARPGHRRLPQPRQETAPLAMRANVEHNHILHEHVVILSIETQTGPVRPRRRAARRSTTSATPTTASPTSAPASATWTTPTSPRAAPTRSRRARMPDRSRRRLLLPLHHRAAPGDAPGHGPLAQAPLHRHLRHHRRRRRVLRPPARPHRDHGLDTSTSDRVGRTSARVSARRPGTTEA